MASSDGGDSRVILDASAVLAVLNRESGQEEVKRRLPGASISCVNLAEVVTKLAERGMGEAEIRGVVDSLALSVVAFDSGMAYRAGMLRPETKDRGLSLGDRACVGTGRALSVVALTMEGAWEGLDGVEVVQR